MLYEDIQMSGSLDITGSFAVPIGTTASAGEYTGSLVYDSTHKKLYVWTGSWGVVGVQSNPESAPNTVFTDIPANLTASISTGTNLISMSLTEADDLESTPYSASISGSSFEIIWSNADSSSGFIKNTTTLSAGTYYYNVTVFDSGSINSQSYNNQTVTVASPPADDGDIDFLVVAGGGSGGRDSNSGGGGAGGLRTSYGSTSGGGSSAESSLSSIASGSIITVTIGAGGADAQASSPYQGNDGSDSSIASSTGTSFTTVTSIGGGGGAGQFTQADGRAGGSGGGGSYDSDGGAGTSGQGFAGGDGVASGDYPGGGGGGAAEAGNTDGQGHGGDGLAVSITGTSITYAGGGGAGRSSGTGDSFPGGDGGGGQGTAHPNDNTPGQPNTGGGGGGYAGGDAGRVGENGGSGIVILSYSTGSISATGGTKTSTSDGRAVHVFRNSSTLNVGNVGENTTYPGDRFNTVTYVGNGGTQAINGVGFQPDLLWLKDRTDNDNHNIGDVIRGAQKFIFTNLSEQEFSSANYFTSFDSDGFTLGSDGSVNRLGSNYVGWCWKAGGSSTSNSNGSVTSDVSANSDAGFSIVKWTGTGAINTVGHGLSSAPELILIKDTDTSSSDWQVYAEPIGNGNKLVLNSSGAQSSTTRWNSTSPTSTVFTLRDIGLEGALIAYCFHSVSGYQKIGSYSGTGSSLEITVGFAPSWVMIKRYASSGDRWLIADKVRGGLTNNDSFVDASANLSERDMNATNGVTFGTNSFTINTTDGALNNSAGTYLYWAIA